MLSFKTIDYQNKNEDKNYKFDSSLTEEKELKFYNMSFKLVFECNICFDYDISLYCKLYCKIPMKINHVPCIRLNRSFSQLR